MNSHDWHEWLDEQKLVVEERLSKQGALVFTYSKYVKQQAFLKPELLRHLIESQCLTTKFSSNDSANAWRQPELSATEADFMRQLRRFRTYHMLWIYWRDLSGDAELEETCSHITWLADYCLDLTHQWAEKVIRQQLSIADAELLPLIIIAMGKYGSEELNVSSDIDLIFCYSNDQLIPDGLRSLEIYYTRLGQLIIRLLDQRTADGFVFRVDMRLRPNGDSGALVISASALESYYLEQGRDWERFALIKARFVTGTSRQVDHLQAILSPFVFRRYIDFSVLDSPREMKRLIQHEIRRRNLGDNIKLGAGGIREIEFITQALQLIHGGKDLELQGRNLLLMLNHIAKIGLIDQDSIQQLRQAYYFLRLLEHRIQAYKDEQSQTLPSDPTRQEILALSMGFKNWNDCKTQLDHHRQQVHDIFTDLFASDDAAVKDEQEIIFSDIWHAALAGDNFTELLMQTQLNPIDLIQQNLAHFASLSVVRKSPPRAEQMLNHLLPAILARLESYSNQAELLQRLLNLILAIISRTAYLELLKENPTALQQVMTLCAKSSMVAEYLSDYPFVLDELISPVTNSLVTEDDFEQQLMQSMNRIPIDDIEARMDVLREVRQTELLRLCAADITEAMDVSSIGMRLSQVATAVIRETVAMAWQLMVDKHGILPSAEKSLSVASPGFCVIAYGKLGGEEMGYSSDLDLVFIYKSTNESTSGPVVLDNKRFYIRLAQKIIHLLSTRTRTGVLYEVDMRLRPSGNSGLLVSDIDAFAKYQSEQAWTWEHQALIRARAVVGDPNLMAQFATVRADILTRIRDPEQLRTDITAMRQRMQKHTISKLKQDEFDLKQSDGGLADIEFLLQYLVLNYANQYPQLIQSSHTETIIQCIAELGLLDKVTVQQLTVHYQRIKSELNHLSLQKQGVATVLTEELKDMVTQNQSLWQTVFHRSD